MFFVPAAAVILIAALSMTACGGGSTGSFSSPPPGSNPPPAGMAAMTVLMGDSPADSVVGFEITVNSIVLTDTSNNTVTVLSTPRRIELSHNSATVEPLSALNVPQGTYTKATITVSNPEVEVVNGSGQVVELSTTLANNSGTVGFSPAVTVGAMATSLSFDFNLAASLTINGNSASVTPVFGASAAAVVAEAEQDDESGQIEDLTGTVSSVSAPTFTIMAGQNSLPITFSTDSNTEFEGVAGIAALQQNMIVQVDAFTQADGTMVAKKVEVEESEASGLEAEGLVTSIAGMPNSFLLVVQDETSASVSMPNVGSVITVNVDGSTHYRIQSDNIDLNGLNFTPTFDASTLAPAQSLEADTGTSGTTSISADTVKLQSQAITGVVSGFVQIDASHASFTLTPAADSVFDSLSTKTSLSVLTTGSTELKDIAAISNGATLRVRGLLFFSGGNYTMVAARVTNP
jgi:hypothetical protein